jgi:hypothetical protein
MAMWDLVALGPCFLTQTNNCAGYITKDEEAGMWRDNEAGAQTTSQSDE